MKIQKALHLPLALALAFFPPAFAQAQGTQFTYQGRVNDSGAPANGRYDLQFTVYDAGTGTNKKGNSFTNAATAVTNGLFTVAMDFGPGIFDGGDRWLEIGIRTNGAVGSFAPLLPRQQITATPYAVFAQAANAAGLVGTIASSNIANGTITSNLLAQGAVGPSQLATNLGVWSQAGGNIFYIAGNVGIGTATPQGALQIVGPVVGGGSANVVAPGIIASTIAGGGVPGFPNSIYGESSFIGAGNNNTISSYLNNSFIGAGYQNTIAAVTSFVGAGNFNTIGTNSPFSFIGSGNANSIQANADISAIAGGAVNAVQIGATGAAIGGGLGNHIGSRYATVSGGYGNSIATNSDYGFIGGGENNVIANLNQQFSLPAVTISGGMGNFVAGYASAAGGGHNNLIGHFADHSTIAGGYANTVIGAEALSVVGTIGGGQGNNLGTNLSFATISGGVSNSIQALAHDAVISGGAFNVVQNGAHDSFLGGGFKNTIESSANNSVIAGGVVNVVQNGANISFLGGGQNNFIGTNAFASALAGGAQNSIQANSYYSFIGSGLNNVIMPLSSHQVIAGGMDNTIQSLSWASAIGGGRGNIAQGYGAVVPGGWSNSATANFSFAAGLQARALHDGSFVWSDDEGVPFASSNTNQFNVRANGGVRFETGGAGMTVDGQPILTAGIPANVARLNGGNTFNGSQFITNGNVGIGTTTPAERLEVAGNIRVPDNAVIGGRQENLASGVLTIQAPGNVSLQGVGSFGGELRLKAGNANTALIPVTGTSAGNDVVIQGGGNTWGNGVDNGNIRFLGGFNAPERMRIVGDTGYVGIGNTNPGNLLVVGGAGSPAYCNGVTWVNGSDRNSKQDFADINPLDILEKVSSLPITEWKYKVEADGHRHVGPMAQDFHAAFGLNGGDETHIATVDESGVALAAIQGLNRKLESGNQKAEVRIRTLESENADLKARVEALEKMFLAQRAN